MNAAVQKTDQDIRLVNATCRDCGQRIPLYLGPVDDILCYHCRHPLSLKWRGGGTPDHNWQDDPSGASASWDMIVRAYEEITT